MDIVWRHCFSVHSPTSENMSATMLAFILRSKGASLKNLYFGRGGEQRIKRQHMYEGSHMSPLLKNEKMTNI